MNPWHNYTFHRILEPDFGKFVEKLTFEIIETISRQGEPDEDYTALNRLYNLGDDNPFKARRVDMEIVLAAYEVLSSEGL